MRFDIETIAPIGILILAGILVYMRRRGLASGYLVCFSVFYIYLLYVVGYTIFPLRVDTDYVEFMRHGHMAKVNLIPFRGLSIDYLLSKQGIGNLALGVPFGFGLPFISRGNFRFVAWRGLIFTVSIELVQLATNLAGYSFPPRIVDVNDVLLNFSGVMIGLGLFHLVARLYKNMVSDSKQNGGIWAYIYFTLTRQ